MSGCKISYPRFLLFGKEGLINFVTLKTYWMTLLLKSVPILCFLLAFISAGCARQEALPSAIREAEGVIMRDPAHALSLLEYYCEPNLNSVEKITQPLSRAKYTLLYSQALDEMRIPVQSDSMIRGALFYYTHSSAYERIVRSAMKEEKAKQKRDGMGSASLYDSLMLDKAKVFFYYGRILENRKNIKDAIAAYLDAAGVLEQRDAERGHMRQYVRMDAENYLKGRIYSVLARMLHEQHSLKDALKYYQTAMPAYEQLGDTVRLMQVAEGKALVQYLMNQYQGALGDYNQALRYAEALGDTTKIIALSRGMAALVFHFTGDIRLTKEFLMNTSERYNYTLDHKDYPLLASVYLREKRVARARFFFEKSLERERSYTPSQKIGMYSIGAKIEAGSGNYVKAYQYSSRMAEIADSLNRSERENLVVGLIQEYNHKKLDMEKEAQAQRHGYRSVIYILIIVISALLIMGAILIILAHRGKIRRKNGEILAYLQQLQAMEEARAGLIGQLDCHVEKEALLKELLQTRFAEVRELARTYYEYGYSKNLQRKVEEILSVQLLQGDSFETIEKVIDARKNNAISKIREAFPGMKEESIKLLCLIYAGFSPQEMCAVLSDTPQNIYVKKYRLKNKLAEFIKINPEADF